MIKLVDKDANRSPDEWGPLFHRILQRRILDWHRRNTLKRRIFSIFLGDDENSNDSLDNFPDTTTWLPEGLADMEKEVGQINPALRALPLRQQQAFLLRQWEGLSIEQTANAMGCSQGSVKTHYSRAMKALRSKLEELDHEH